MRGQFSMKRISYIISLLLAFGPAPAMALSCVASPGYVQYDPANLQGNTACYPSNGPPWTNQEFHSGGTLTDWKLGSNQADPTATVGTYSINPDIHTITYTYGSASFTYSIWGPTTVTGLFDFCLNGTTPLSVTIMSGSGPCRGSAS
jgi:hypothetical protein